MNKKSDNENFINHIQIKEPNDAGKYKQRSNNPSKELIEKLNEIRSKIEDIQEIQYIKKARIPNKVILKCLECGYIRKIPSEQLRSTGKIKIKQHHGLDMEIVITQEQQTKFE